MEMGEYGEVRKEQKKEKETNKEWRHRMCIDVSRFAHLAAAVAESGS